MNDNAKISIAVENAYASMVGYCFRSFNIVKWLGIAFVAWVMTFGNNGGAFSVIQFASYIPGAVKDPKEMEQFFTSEIITTIIIAAVVLFLLFIALWVVTAWLKARFEFIFLNNIVLMI